MRIPLPVLALVVALGLVMFPGGLTTPTPAGANGCDRQEFAGGTGSEADPFLIATRTQLISLSTQGGSCASYAFRQTADIDLSDHSWTPIGDVNNAFGGIYDGGGYRISGITVDTGGEGLGFFGRVSGATIRDLVLVAPRIVGASPNAGRGALAGNALASIIRSVHVVGGSVEGTDAIGGLVGGMYDTEVRASTASAAVSGVNVIGGLIGFTCTVCVASLSADASPRAPAPTFAGVIESAATGAVTASGGTAGGLVGESASDIVRSYATGAVSAGVGTAGGLVGYADGSVVVAVPIASQGIVDAYATGTVNAPERVGGLVGAARSGLSITRSFAVGRVEGSSETGGLVGATVICPSSVHVGICSTELAASAATASFWDVETTGKATSVSGFGEGRTSAQMKTEATFVQAGWVIAGGWRAASDTAVWGICPGANDGYPFLLWQYDATTETCTTTPSAPRDLSVKPGLRRVVATWQSPASDGYAPIASYTVTATPVGAGRSSAKTCTAEATATKCVITGLRAGRYTISATAANIKGAGAAATIRARVAVPLRVTQRACPMRWSARAKRLARCTTATVPARGRVRQVGTVRVGNTRVAVCRFEVRVPRAGTAGLACRLSARGRALARGEALTVRLATTFDPFDGADARRSTLVRFAALSPVTG